MGNIICYDNPMKNTVKILSIDGGGIYGMSSALVLAEIEKRTKKPLSKLFDLIAGTSTGGIISLGVTLPNKDNLPKYKASDLADLYVNYGGEIFHNSLFRKIITAGGILQEKYSDAAFNRVLGEYFGDTLLSKSITPLLITAYDMERRQTHLFKSVKALFSQERDFYMRDVARSTSSAPAFFEPAHIKSISSEEFTLIDGGVFANNPTLCAYVEARTLFPDSNITLISVGAEWPRDPYPYEKAKNWGILGFGGPLIDIFFDGQGDVTRYQLDNLFPVNSVTKNKYYCLSPKILIERGKAGLDDVSPENIQRIKTSSAQYIHENETLISEVCKALHSN